MKTLICSFLACMAFMQLQAIPSNLEESKREFQAILDSPLLTDAIPQGEFIFEIDRKTRRIEASHVRYLVTTATGSVFPMGDHHHHHCKSHQYEVLLTLTPNPEIGPPIITVDSVTRLPCHGDHHDEDSSSSSSSDS